MLCTGLLQVSSFPSAQATRLGSLAFDWRRLARIGDRTDQSYGRSVFSLHQSVQRAIRDGQ